MQTETTIDRDAIIKQLQKPETKELELPKPANKAHAFYAVYLKNDRNDRGEVGPFPAIPIDNFQTALVEDPDHPTKPFRYGDYDDPIDRKRAREFPKRLVITDKYGEPVMFTRRAWRLVADGKRHVHLFEDPRATKAHRTNTGFCDSVYRVQLWCPHLGRDFLGNRQEHGEFLGKGEHTTGVGRRQKQMGVCPSCQRDRSEKQAAEKIAKYYEEVAPEVNRG